MELKNKLTSIFTLGTLLLISSCLPMQKMTQCGENEAFNATNRKCLPVIGAASTNTVFIKSKSPSNSYTASINSSTINHAISVSDIYNYGYSTKWHVHYNNGSSQTSNVVASNTLVYSFNPPTQFGAGDYIVEAVLYDQSGATPLDSVSWNIKLISLTAPTLKNPSPASSSFSYSTSITSATINIDIDNPDGLSGPATWLVDGATVATPNFNSATTGFSTTINPQALGLGIHTVEMRITDASNNLYDSYVWVINVVNPDLPVFGAADPGYNHTILAIDAQSYNSANGGYFYDHDSDNNFLTPLENIATKAQTGGTPGICVTVDNWDKNSDGVADVYLVFDINGSQQGAQVNLTANTYCIEDDLSAQFLTNSEIGVSKTLTVSSYKFGTSTLLEQKSWGMNVLPKNSAPIIQISSNTDAFGCTETTDVHHTNCSATQSLDDNIDLDYLDATDVNNVIKLAIDVVQDFETDYNNDGAAFGEDNNEVYFQIKKAGDASFQDIDLASDYTKANCVTGTGSKAAITDSSVPTGAVTTYFCNLSFDAFNANGPIDSGDYIIKAFVTDAGSQWGGIAKDSNSVKWEVSITEHQTAPEIQDQDSTQNALATINAANQSYITSSSNGAGCADSGFVLYNGNSIQEGQHIILHTVVKDLERDNMTLSVKMENLVAGAGSFSTVSSLQNVTRSDDNEYYEIQTCFKVPEWANTSATQTVKIVATVNDAPDNAATSLSDSNSGVDAFSLEVQNVNPPPTFSDYAAVENIRDLSLDSLGNPEPTYVLSGFPFTLDPPTYADASSSDGKNVSWQWQVCVGDPGTTCAVATAAWEDIPGANTANQISENLIWTPDPSIAAGATVNLRICLGDDGDGNPADCSDDPESRKTYTNIIANPSSTISAASLANVSSGNELASWTDATSGFHYIAYASGTNIHVEKLSNDDEGAWTSVHSISFESEDSAAGLTPVAVHDLSMTGQDQQALLIAYKIFENSTNNPVIRIRRIDISNGKLSFNYSGLFNPLETGDNDMVVGLDSSGPETSLSNTTFSGSGNAQLNITFSAIPTGTVSFRLADGGAQVDLAYGTDFCSGGVCTTTTLVAQGLADAINGHPRLSQEFLASAATNVTTINGPPADDYKDLNSELAISVGNIAIQNGLWFVPFADGSNSVKTTLIIGGDPAVDFLSGPVAATKFINTKTFVSEIKLAPHGASELVLLTKAGANLHAYILNSSYNVVFSNENVFDLTGLAEIKNISLSVGTGDFIFMAGVSEDSSGDTFLNSAVFPSDLSSVSATSLFTGSSNDLTQLGVDKVAIAASPTTAGEAVVALTTSSSHASIANQAHFVQISQDTSNFSNPIILTDYQIATSNSSPKADINSSYNGGGLAISPVMNLTKGHSDESDNPPADNTQPSVFFSFHENNLGVAEIRTGIYNISSEDISTDDDSVSGSYPAFISN